MHFPLVLCFGFVPIVLEIVLMDKHDGQNGDWKSIDLELSNSSMEREKSWVESLIGIVLAFIELELRFSSYLKSKYMQNKEFISKFIITSWFATIMTLKWPFLIRIVDIYFVEFFNLDSSNRNDFISTLRVNSRIPLLLDCSCSLFALSFTFTWNIFPWFKKMMSQTANCYRTAINVMENSVIKTKNSHKIIHCYQRELFFSVSEWRSINVIFFHCRLCIWWKNQNSKSFLEDRRLRWNGSFYFCCNQVGTWRKSTKQKHKNIKL